MTDRLSPVSVEAMHGGLTEIFLKANYNGVEDADVPVKHPAPPVIKLDTNITARDITHSFHNDYFGINSDHYLAGMSTEARKALTTYQERRHKRLYFLGLHQAFFEVYTTHNTMYVIGDRDLHGPDSLAPHFGERTPNSDTAGITTTSEQIIMSPPENRASSLAIISTGSSASQAVEDIFNICSLIQSQQES